MTIPKVIDLDSRRPHRVAHVRCRACGHAYVSVHPTVVDTERLQCPRCLAQDSGLCGLGGSCETCLMIVEDPGE